MFYIRQEVLKEQDETDEVITPDAEFEPNLMNSAMYLVSLIMQVSTFAINYQVGDSSVFSWMG
jgi:cation-transporting ATPase 13A1